MKSYLAAPLVVFLLAACASSGIKVDQAKLAQFHKGETTYSEVVQKLGKPSQVIMSEDGRKTILYVYSSAQARPENFIPIAGAFMGGMDTENSAVTMRFDRDDVLEGMTSSQRSTGTGTGFEAISQPRNSAQPGIAR